MDIKLKIVTHLPLRELWRDDGFISASRGRSLTRDDITDLLWAGAVSFVVADVGLSLQWIQLDDCYQFWKDEVKSHLAEGSRAFLDDFPGSYFYFAFEWPTAREHHRLLFLRSITDKC